MALYIILALALLATCSGTFIKVPGQCPDDIQVVSGFTSSDTNGLFEVIASSSLGPQNIRQTREFGNADECFNVYTSPTEGNITGGFNVIKTDRESVFNLIPKENLDVATLVPLKAYALGVMEFSGNKFYTGYACGNIDEESKQEEISIWTRNPVPDAELIMNYTQIAYKDLYPMLEPSFKNMKVVGN